jgi:peptidoglycan LD-endopeptidase LytH
VLLTRKRWIIAIVTVIVLVVGVVVGGYLFVRYAGRFTSNSLPPIRQWFENPGSRAELATVQRGVACPGAPFILPSDGLIGLLWNDPASPYTITTTHSGIDIFGDGEPGEVPIYAAYAGYLSRLESWISTVIIRHDDPLEPGRTIWTYYTHMASRDARESFIVDDFPPGTSDEPVEQGTLLGYQGEYAGEGAAPIGLHLHFSIVLSEPEGGFRNEARVANTLDPSPYFGMNVNIAGWPERPIRCKSISR